MAPRRDDAVEAMEVQKQEIGGRIIETQVFLAETTIVLFVDLIRLFGEPIKTLLMAATNPAEAEKRVAEILPQLMSGAFANVKDPQEVVTFIKAMLKKTTVNNIDADLNKHFTGRLGELAKVLIWLVRLNFGGFSSAFASRERQDT